MKIAIISRNGPCFPNNISQGLVHTLSELEVESKIFYDGIPMLMRLLPLRKQPKRWYNNLSFRIRNKIRYFRKDRKLIRQLSQFNAVIISECYGNAFWKNYLAIEEFKNHITGKLISYTESPLDSAPANKKRELDNDDYDESIYDINLFVTDLMEVKKEVKSNQAVAGVNISYVPELTYRQKKKLTAVLDFAQPGFERYRQQQVNALNELGIYTITLNGRYPIEDIRAIYSEATFFFLSFPETFGLPIAECLACGAYIFTPESSWPMAWRLDEHPESMSPGILPDCFKVYNNEDDLKRILTDLMKNYDFEKTPEEVIGIYIKYYRRFFYGDTAAVGKILKQIN